MMALFISILLGVIFWTFAEYILHRFWGHQADAKKCFNVFTRLHLKHHQVKGFYANLKQKLTLMILVGGISYPLVNLIFAQKIAVGFALGMVGMAFIYEHIHYIIHEKEPKSSYGLWARRHHLAHHFCNPKLNHGVTSCFWDVVFGTYKKYPLIKIPKSLCNDWLLDSETADIKVPWQRYFRLR